MNAFTRPLIYSAASACLVLALGAAPALARTHHHHHGHHSKHHTTRHATESTIVRIAQQHLSNLGYYAGSVDGIMGSGTRAAIMRFQREHSLKVDGKLGPKTNRALEQNDPHAVYGSHSFMTHDTLATAPNADTSTNPDFDHSLNGGSKTVARRFAQVDVAESGEGAGKRYSVNVNGQPVLIADGQPSVIGVSPTYDLGDEDALVLTTFSPSDTGCTYRNHVLALTPQGSKLLDVENCTRNYQAQVTNGMLYINFPEKDDNRAVPAVWRLEGSQLNRL